MPVAEELRLEEFQIGRHMSFHRDHNHFLPLLVIRNHSHSHMGHPQDLRIESGTCCIIRSRVTVIDLFLPSADLYEMLLGCCYFETWMDALELEVHGTCGTSRLDQPTSLADQQRNGSKRLHLCDRNDMISQGFT